MLGLGPERGPWSQVEGAGEPRLPSPDTRLSGAVGISQEAASRRPKKPIGGKVVFTQI